MRALYGVPSLLLSDAVANFMIEQGNSNQSHYPANLTRAARTWEDLMMDTIFTIKYKAVKVNKKDNSVRVPSDSIRMFGAFIVDKCGMMVPIGFNPDFNTLALDCPAKTCSCTSCGGQDTLCVALDAVSVVYSTVDINGYPFQVRTWTQKGEGGLLQQVTEIPYPDFPYPMSGPPTVTYKTEYKNLCNLDVTVNNCIKPTEANRNLLVTHCGCTIPSWHSEVCCSDRFFPKSDYGYWNWKANCNDVIVLKDVSADYIIFGYQSSGNCGADELVIPRIALDPLHFGIRWRQIAWSPAFNRLEKQAALADYDRAKEKLFIFLHPVDIKVMDQMSAIIMKW